MTRIAFDKPTRDSLSRLLRSHLKDEAGVEIDPVDAQALLDFLAETLGPHFYNQGVFDAEAVLKARTEDIAEAIGGLARPIRR